jgi:hypothetical protein
MRAWTDTTTVKRVKLLPRDLLPPDQVFERAAPFLLKALLAAKDEDLVNYYCPYSHAAHSLLLLTGGERR